MFRRFLYGQGFRRVWKVRKVLGGLTRFSGAAIACGGVSERPKSTEDKIV